MCNVAYRGVVQAIGSVIVLGGNIIRKRSIFRVTAA